MSEEEITFVVTKEQLRDSGFGALWDPEEEWWAGCPPAVVVTITDDEVRYCFDIDEHGFFVGYHFDDYYDYGEDAVKFALALYRQMKKA
jgi:hypothetical protein